MQHEAHPPWRSRFASRRRRSHRRTLQHTVFCARTVASVPTYDLSDPAVRDDVLARLDQVVVKPRSASGGQGVLVGPHARPADRGRAARAVVVDPEAFVAQETVWLSRHPTVVDGHLEPRHVDLRAFVLVTGDGPRALPGGLTRFALERDALVANTSQDGGAKDIWVLA
jgi:uncharacterized circularly permuted ATP-grasp superfamily protein